MTFRLRYAVICLTALILMVGCEGNPGKPGESLLPDDLYPPDAEIILPQPAKPIFDQSVVEIRVNDDDSVARVEFLVDGSSPVAGSFRTIDLMRLYSWNCGNLPTGQHSLQLLAWDNHNRMGVSIPLFLAKLPVDSIPQYDTLRYYAFTKETAVDWKLPSDTSAHFFGFATRFTPDRPCVIIAVDVRIKQKLAWQGTQLYLDLMTSNEGKPDSLLYRKTIIIRSGGSQQDFNDWIEKTYAGVSVNGEFFVTVTLSDKAKGDTLAVQTDPGVWQTGHGLVKRNGEWQSFNAGRTRSYNPLIYAVVQYR
jgi:hypothetical protein